MCVWYVYEYINCGYYTQREMRHELNKSFTKYCTKTFIYILYANKDFIVSRWWCSFKGISSGNKHIICSSRVKLTLESVCVCVKLNEIKWINGLKSFFISNALLTSLSKLTHSQVELDPVVSLSRLSLVWHYFCLSKPLSSLSTSGSIFSLHLKDKRTC